MFNVLHLGKYVPMLLFFKDLWLEFILTYKELVTFFRADAVTCNYVNYSHGLKKLPHKTIVLWVVYDCLIHQLKLYLKKKKKKHITTTSLFSLPPFLLLTSGFSKWTRLREEITGVFQLRKIISIYWEDIFPLWGLGKVKELWVHTWSLCIYFTSLFWVKRGQKCLLVLSFHSSLQIIHCVEWFQLYLKSSSLAWGLNSGLVIMASEQV